MTRKEILDKATEQVTGHRETDYGTPEDNFSVIGKLWSAYLDIEVTSKDVAMMMALMKIGRIKSGTATNDSFVDLAGYAACGGEIVSKERSRGVVPAPPKYKVGDKFLYSFSHGNRIVEIIEIQPWCDRIYRVKDDHNSIYNVYENELFEPKIMCASDSFPTSWSNSAIADGLIHEGWNYDTWLKVVKERGEADWKDFIMFYDDAYKIARVTDKCAMHVINYRSTEDVIQWGRDYDKKQKEKNSN
jgi:hypothetical protein